MATDDVNSNYEDRVENARLYLAALKGDWESVRDMPSIQRVITNKKETTLHIAAAASQEEFVKNLVNIVSDNDLKVETEKGITALSYAAATGNVNIAKAIVEKNNDLPAASQEEFVKNLENIESDNDLEAETIKGNTALSYAAATGNVNIAKAIVEKNNDLPNLPSRGVKPLYIAALFGHSQMVDYLSKLPTTKWETKEEVELFVTYASVGFYVKALQMLEVNSSLATSKNEDGETALYMLARNPSAFDSGSQPGILRRHINSWMTVKDDQNTKQTPAHQLLREICKWSYKSDDVQFYKVEMPQQLIFAAKVGNVQFLIELIRSDPNLLWKIDSKRRTIFHIAVEERHESIFNLLYEIGSLKDLLVEYITEDGNNILHLAAKLSPQHKLNAKSGAALQMQQELLWFKEVEKVVHPSFKKMKNNNEETPDVLFAKAHENLRQEGEKWMRKTATSSMVVAALIAQIVFSGQPDNGLNHSSEKSKFVLASSISSAIALFSSSTSLIMFLSILTSRYSNNDYLVSLPTRLMIGVTSLFISIAAMLAAFYASFCSKYHNYHQGFPLIAVLIGLFACLPILYGLLKYRLLSDIVQSTYCSRSMFQPRQRLLY